MRKIMSLHPTPSGEAPLTIWRKRKGEGLYVKEFSEM